MGDYLGCLYFISKGLQMDLGFTKGHVFKERIFKNSPSLISDFPVFYPMVKVFSKLIFLCIKYTFKRDEISLEIFQCFT